MVLQTNYQYQLFEKWGYLCKKKKKDKTVDDDNVTAANWAIKALLKNCLEYCFKWRPFDAHKYHNGKITIESSL